jgi:hypothetical protein
MIDPEHDLSIKRQAEVLEISRSTVYYEPRPTSPEDLWLMPMQSKDKVANARMWVYVGDQEHPYNVFDFTMDRCRNGPTRFLKDYNQVLLADGYAGYNGVVVGNAITRAGCWAHMKRKLVEAEKSAPEIAREAVERVRALYAVERLAKDASRETRLQLRGEKSRPLLAKLHD